MNPETTPDAVGGDTLQEQPAPACVMSFNASDPTGAGGLAADVATIAAMGAHALPVVTSIVMRDTAEVFDQHVIDADVVVEQARSILEDVTISGWKVGFLVKITAGPGARGNPGGSRGEESPRLRGSKQQAVSFLWRYSPECGTTKRTPAFIGALRNGRGWKRTRRRQRHEKGTGRGDARAGGPSGADATGRPRATAKIHPRFARVVPKT